MDWKTSEVAENGEIPLEIEIRGRDFALTVYLDTCVSLCTRLLRYLFSTCLSRERSDKRNDFKWICCPKSLEFFLKQPSLLLVRIY